MGRFARTNTLWPQPTTFAMLSTLLSAGDLMEGAWTPQRTMMIASGKFLRGMTYARACLCMWVFASASDWCVCVVSKDFRGPGIVKERCPVGLSGVKVDADKLCAIPGLLLLTHTLLTTKTAD